MLEQLEVTVDRLQYGTDTALAYIDLLGDPGELYKRASDAVRRDLLTAYFDSMIVRVEDNRVHVAGARRAISTRLREVGGEIAIAEGQDNQGKTETPRSRAGSSVRSTVSSFDHGSSNVRMAGVPGLEPRTTEPETAVLPITPYPTGHDRNRADDPV